MSYSLYEIDGYQDYSKPSDHFTENWYLQDVFFNNRPEVLNYDDNSTENRDDKRDPYFRERDRDQKEDKGDSEKTEFHDTYQPQNWQKQEPIMVNPYRRHSYKKAIKKRLAKKHRKTAKSIFTLNYLMGHVREFSLRQTPLRAKRSVARKYKSDVKNLAFSYKVQGYEKWSKGPHTVFLKFDPKRNELDIRKWNVEVKCTCPYWKYWGPDFNANKNDYLLGMPTSDLSFPKENDPEENNLICKHVYAVGTLLQDFVAKHNLDTYKQLGELKDILEDKQKKYSYETKMELVKEVIRFMNRSEQRQLAPLVRNFENQTKEQRQLVAYTKLIQKILELEEYQDKKFLIKVLSSVKNKLKELERGQIREERRVKRQEVKKRKEERQLEEKRKQEELKKEREIEREKKKKEREEKAQERKEKIKTRIKQKQKPSRIKKKLKRFVKKTHIDKSSSVHRVMDMYLRELGERYGDL